MSNNAILFGTDMQNADCSGAVFSNAILAEANLSGANFSMTDLTNADLAGADFLNTNLHGADLTNANLAGAQNLTVAQLATTRTLAGARLDEELLAGVQELNPQLLEVKE